MNIGKGVKIQLIKVGFSLKKTLYVLINVLTE